MVFSVDCSLNYSHHKYNTKQNIKTNKIYDVLMAFWKIKFGKKKINLFKDVCMVMLTKSVNKSFLLTLSL